MKTLAQHLSLIKATEYIQIQAVFFGNRSTSKFLAELKQYMKIADDHGCVFEYVEELRGGLVEMFFVTDSEPLAKDCVQNFWDVKGVVSVGCYFASPDIDAGLQVLRKTAA
jgi:hypothetical protein